MQPMQQVQCNLFFMADIGGPHGGEERQGTRGRLQRSVSYATSLQEGHSPVADLGYSGTVTIRSIRTGAQEKQGIGIGIQ